jgi:ABC-type glycerol-3-phosphate transport system substrate-binding protein
MMRKWIAAVAVAGLVTACGGDDRNGDGTLTQDTTMLIQPDTSLIERTITVDTISDPDLQRDTLRRDTLGQPGQPR